MQLTRETRGEMKIPCKNCHFVTKYSVSYIEDAISDGLQLTCSVCEKKFKVVVMPLDTIAVQQNAHQTATPYCQHISENIDGTCPYCDLPKPPVEAASHSVSSTEKLDGATCPTHGLKLVDGYCPSLTCVYSPPRTQIMRAVESST